MRKQHQKKSPFSDLDDDFKDTVANMSDDEIKRKLAEIAINDHENTEAKKQDQDLESKKQVYSMACEPYKEAKKANRLRTSYCYSILESRGKV